MWGVVVLIILPRDLSYDAWRRVLELYWSNPLQHCYLLYDLVYEPDKTTVWFLGVSEGYVLRWCSRRVCGVHVEGNVEKLLNAVGEAVETAPARLVWVHVPLGAGCELVTSLLDRLGYRYERRVFLDMAVELKDYREPPGLKPCRRLGVEDLDEFMEVKRLQGRPVTREEAVEMLSRKLYYGCHHNDKLVSIAGAYARLPEVWVIGDVYTLPEYRGRGYGTSVTAAVTRIAVESGATALLHVDETNEPALRIYRKLGYKTKRRRLWLKITI